MAVPLLVGWAYLSRSFPPPPSWGVHPGGWVGGWASQGGLVAKATPKDVIQRLTTMGGAPPPPPSHPPDQDFIAGNNKIYRRKYRFGLLSVHKFLGSRPPPRLHT